MRGLAFILIYFLYSNVLADSIDVEKIRVLYQKSVSDEKSCNEMILLLSEINEDKPLLLGYRASGMMMMAKYVQSPFSKLSYFKKGKKMLDEAIDLDVKNIELRFLRFMAQTNAPSFLGYSVNIESDKNIILRNISRMVDLKLKYFMVMILRKSKYLNSEENRLLIY